ncbi:MAG: hypothetical protein WC683_13115 [bacterium]
MIITHRNIAEVREALSRELRSHDRPGYIAGPEDVSCKWRETVTLEFPTGELCDDGLKTLALTGGARAFPVPLTGNEGFAAQGLEGKVCVDMPLCQALCRMDLLPKGRGRITRVIL